VNFLAFGPVYEPLAFVNNLQSGKATGWTWSDGNKILTFTIRSGVKWSDGKPMTAADVVYTFNLLKKYPAWTSTRSGPRCAVWSRRAPTRW
jgi:peptide/nickel transport system substrate-binding protein